MTVAEQSSEQEVRPAARRTLRRLFVGTPTDALAVVCVALPFLVVGVRYGLEGQLTNGGDQALIQLDLFDLAHLDQGVGLYSRMGWAHPGPAWLVLLWPFYALFSGTGAALTAASLLVHGLMAALVVLLAGSGARWHRPVAAAVVLLYVLRMPAGDFVGVWNPFALLLATALFLLVATRACCGSPVAAVGTVVVGSYLVQTHVGTAPLAGAVGLVMVAVLAARVRRRRLRWPAHHPRLQLAACVLLLVAMWVPPVVQQLTSAGEGNLTLLVEGILAGEPGARSPTWVETVSFTGQQLGAAVFGWPALPALVDPTILTPAVLAAVVVQLVGCGAVAAVALRRGIRDAGWLALLTGAATVAGLVAVHSITGLLMNYLALWISVLPAVAFFAGLLLVGSRTSSRQRPRLGGAAVGRSVRTRSAALCAAGLVTAAVLSVGVTISLHDAAPLGPRGQLGADRAAQLALSALPPATEEERVLLDIQDVDTWTTATAVALRLTEAGYEVSVADRWVYGFGVDRRSDGREQWVVSLRSSPPGTPALLDEVGLVDGANGPLAVGVAPAR